MRPCACDGIRVAEPYDLSQCRLCWLWHNDAAYRELWSGQPPPPRLALAAPCRHGPGEPTGGTVTCQTCRGTVRLKLFACGKYGVCTAQKRTAGVACCEGCPGHEPAA